MQTADHILIPLLDGKYALAQVARIEDSRALIFLARTKATKTAPTAPLDPEQVIGAVTVDAALLPTDTWPIVGYEAVPRIAPFADLPLSDIDPTDPAIVEAFANAIHGLYPWDGFPDPDFFNAMLRDPDTLPTLARMTADFPTPDTDH